ncbi:hypothetical protein D9M70_603300 [compost metagenome]
MRRSQEILDEAKLMLQLAEDEKREGSYGAENWRDYQSLVLRRASEIVRIHADVTIPDGTLVQVSNLDEQERK